MIVPASRTTPPRPVCCSRRISALSAAVMLSGSGLRPPDQLEQPPLVRHELAQLALGLVPLHAQPVELRSLGRGGEPPVERGDQRPQVLGRVPPHAEPQPGDRERGDLLVGTQAEPLELDRPDLDGHAAQLAGARGELAGRTRGHPPRLDEQADPLDQRPEDRDRQQRRVGGRRRLRAHVAANAERPEVHARDALEVLLRADEDVVQLDVGDADVGLPRVREVVGWNSAHTLIPRALTRPVWSDQPVPTMPIVSSSSAGRRQPERPHALVPAHRDLVGRDDLLAAALPGRGRRARPRPTRRPRRGSARPRRRRRACPACPAGSRCPSSSATGFDVEAAPEPVADDDAQRLRR